MSAPDTLRIVPEPDAERAAAIVAALTTLWSAGGAEDEPPESSWRFSGRWWSRPVPQRRNRPG